MEIRKDYISNRVFPSDYLNNMLKLYVKWTNNIENNNNFSVVKFGDGELLSIGSDKIDKTIVVNCDGHSFRDCDLPNKLKNAWDFFIKYDNIYIAEWTSEPFRKDNEESITYKIKKEIEKGLDINYVNYEILLQNTLIQEKYDFFNSIRKSKRKKIFIGPERLHRGVSKWLNTINIKVPLKNVISEYDNILNQIYNEIEDNCIIMFSCSIPAKSLIHKSLEKNINITCLDIGSGFDMMFHGFTREGQLPQEIIHNYYSINNI